MQKTTVVIILALLVSTSALMAQYPSGSSSDATASASQPGQSGQSDLGAPPTKKKSEAKLKPFSRLAIGGGISMMGINLQAATNVNRYLNVRGLGNVFDYTVNNITVSNFSVNGKANFATAGVSLDYYPFPMHGFRLSPGVLFYNQNEITASGVGSAGSSISLDGTKYYSETANPIAMNAALLLNTRKQAATLTTGWGNMISRRGGHWAFPFEIGAAFTGVPGINVGLSGYGCTTQSDAATSGPSCVNMATNSTAQGYLTTQIAKWESDLNALQVYPIFSFGVTYNFSIR